MAFRQEKPMPEEEGLLTMDRVRELAEQTPRWTVHLRSIEREFIFEDFRTAIAFVNRVAEQAEQLQHHPDINISYNKVRLELSTHKIGGLSPKDFELAERIDRLMGG